MVIRNSVVPILVLCLLVPTVRSQVRQEVDPDRTLVWLNGRFWKKIPSEEKAGFLIGFHEGLNINTAGDKACLDMQTRIKDNFRSTLNYEEMETEVDSFYKEGANGPLPITVALQYLAKKSKGATSKELEEFVTSNRKHFAGTDK